jgi:hypothetical protein
MGEPVRAGVDPFHKLIDRDPDDNTVTVEAAAKPRPDAEVSQRR